MKRNTVRSCLASLIVGGALLSTVSGCGPRGESRTVDELLTDARTSYQSAYSKTNAGIQGNLKSLASSLDRIAGLGGGGDARQVAGDIASTLTDLSTKAGYTARPAMAELISQYRTVSERTDVAVSIGAANLKLLAARTYALLSNELKTTQFRL